MKGLLFTLFVSATAATKVDIIWRREHSSGKTSLKVLDNKSLGKVAATCGSILHAEYAIDFTSVDKLGVGNFMVGEKNYTVHSKTDVSGGPACSRIYNDEVSFVDCTGIEWSETGVKANGNEDCFDNEASIHAFSMLETHNRADKRNVGQKELEARQWTKKLDKRQWIGTCTDQSWTELVGDGDPHQNYLLKQLSENIDCDAAPSCTVGQSDSTSFAIGATFGIAGSKPFGWITGGFSVTQTWTTGNSYSCNGGQGEEVCVWYNTAHTAYTVQIKEFVCDAPSYRYDGPYILKSPNDNNKGGGYYCVVGTCRSQGEEYWDNSGRAGGP